MFRTLRTSMEAQRCSRDGGVAPLFALPFRNTSHDFSDMRVSLIDGHTCTGGMEIPVKECVCTHGRCLFEGSCGGLKGTPKGNHS